MAVRVLNLHITLIKLQAKFVFFLKIITCLLISRPFGDFPNKLNVYILRTKTNNTGCLLLFSPDYKDLLTKPSELVHFALARLSI